MKKINKLKKGEFFKLKQDSKTVWVFDGYNRSSKKYSAYQFDDISKFKEMPKEREVFIEFEF